MIEHEVRITVYLGREPEDITLRYPLDPEYDALLKRLHANKTDLRGVLSCRMHDRDPALADLLGPDGRIPNTWLYLRPDPRSGGRLLLCHWPNGPVKGSHRLPHPMSDEHRRRQEYIARRGQEAGYDVETEKSLTKGSTRSDVVIRGAAVMTAEVQQSNITLSTVLRRDRAVAKAGATPAWFADRKDPDWAFKVAHIETNERPGLDPRTWTVSTGPRRLERERCTPRSRFPSCPELRRNWCGREHWIWVPLAGLTVDDVVEQAPAGALVRLDTGKGQGVILTTPNDRDEWLASIPEQRTPVRELRRQAGVAHPQYPSDRLRSAVAERSVPPMLDTSSGSASAATRPPATRPPYANPAAECPNWGKGPCGGSGVPCTRCEPL